MIEIDVAARKAKREKVPVIINFLNFGMNCETLLNQTRVLVACSLQSFFFLVAVQVDDPHGHPVQEPRSVFPPWRVGQGRHHGRAHSAVQGRGGRKGGGQQVSRLA